VKRARFLPLFLLFFVVLLNHLFVFFVCLATFKIKQIFRLSLRHSMKRKRARELSRGTRSRRVRVEKKILKKNSDDIPKIRFFFFIPKKDESCFASLSSLPRHSTQNKTKTTTKFSRSLPTPNSFSLSRALRIFAEKRTALKREKRVVNMHHR
jgi:hypothetical protein